MLPRPGDPSTPHLRLEGPRGVPRLARIRRQLQLQRLPHQLGVLHLHRRRCRQGRGRRRDGQEVGAQPWQEPRRHPLLSGGLGCATLAGEALLLAALAPGALAAKERQANKQFGRRLYWTAPARSGISQQLPSQPRPAAPAHPPAPFSRENSTKAKPEPMPTRVQERMRPHFEKTASTCGVREGGGPRAVGMQVQGRVQAVVEACGSRLGAIEGLRAAVICLGSRSLRRCMVWACGRGALPAGRAGR